jgi:hypothetical protein
MRLYTAVIDRKTYPDIKAEGPIQAGIIARDQHFFPDTPPFTDVTVFEGKAPECIHNPCGTWSL